MTKFLTKIISKWKVYKLTSTKTIISSVLLTFAYLTTLGNNTPKPIKSDNVSPLVTLSIDTVKKKNISGVVKGIDGLGIQGVSVMVKGTSYGSMTRAEGRYTLLNVPDNAVLVFRFIGMETFETAINGRSVINITLKDNQSDLNDVVVVGYGKQEKLSVTGAVSSIKTDVIKQSPSPNVVGALTGRLPGLVVTQGSGRPGGESYGIYLRGLSTLNGSSPLILVDGVPRDNISMLDPNEIESVTVLKDASATAVFGVRGANGVILITTRVGTTGKPAISFTYELGLQHFTNETKMFDSWDYAAMRNQALINDGYAAKYSQRQIDLMKAGTSDLYPNTDWFSKILKNTAPLSRYNVNMSGGNDRFKYFVNVGVLDQDGMYNTLSKDELGYDPQFKLKKYNFRTNVEMKVNNWISTGVKFGGYVNNVNGTESGASTVYADINLMTPVTPGPLSPAGFEQYGVAEGYPITPGNVSYKNPYAQLNYTGYSNTESSNLSTSAYMDFDLSKITKGLKSRVMASFDTYSSATTTGSKSYNSYQYDVNEVLGLDGVIFDEVSFKPEKELQYYPITLAKSSTFRYDANFQWVINYDRTFNKIHKVSGMILAQRDNSEIASGTSDELLPYNYLGVASRATYRLKDRYLAEFNIGYNGSEQFAKGKRFGLFPAGSVGWVVSNEPFMKNLPFVSSMKLRASYGKVGSDQIGAARFLYIDKMNVLSTNLINTISSVFVSENLLGNPNITWEEAYKQNYGLDLSFLKNSLTFTVDVFKERREQILITRTSVPEVTGLTDIYPKANLGIVENKGIELEAKYTKKINKDFTFSVYNTFSFAKNKILFSDEVNKGAEYYLKYSKQGQSINQFVGYNVDWNSIGHGYYVSQDEISQYTYSGKRPRLGDLKYLDLNGDGNIGPEDANTIGYSDVPRISYSSTFSFSYKGFDLSLMFQGVAQVTKNFTASGVWEYGDPASYFDYQRNNWTIERYQSGAEISYPALSAYTASSSQTINSFYTTDVSYLRLKNAEFGYTFPKGIKKVGINSLRVYTNANNLITWTDNRFTHLDPEIGRSPLVPITQIFNFGLNATF